VLRGQHSTGVIILAASSCCFWFAVWFFLLGFGVGVLGVVRLLYLVVVSSRLLAAFPVQSKWFYIDVILNLRGVLGVIVRNISFVNCCFFPFRRAALYLPRLR
jgi:hypothetical protein